MQSSILPITISSCDPVRRQPCLCRTAMTVLALVNLPSSPTATPGTKLWRKAGYAFEVTVTGVTVSSFVRKSPNKEPKTRPCNLEDIRWFHKISSPTATH